MNEKLGRKILIVSPAWVGDTVMAQCLFQQLKKNDATAIIDVLALPLLHPLLKRMPEVRETIALPFKHGELNLRERFHISQQLRDSRYDQAIVLPNSFKSALIPVWAKIPHRTGWVGEWRWGLLNDSRILDKKKYPLMIERFTALAFETKNSNLADISWPSLSIEKESLNKTLAHYQLNHDKPILALCPGAEYGSSKRWPTDYYAQVAQAKIAEGWQVWLFGGGQERYLGNEIQQATKNQCVDLIGKTNLGEAIDLLSAADAVVSNDSGLMHIAAALKRPLIAIYGSSSPAFTPPLSKDAKILSLGIECSPCFERTCPLGHWRCMRDLYPAQVLNTLREMNLCTS